MRHARPDYDRIQDPEGRIPADEPVFLLRAQDKAAPSAVMHWIEQARVFGASHEIRQAAYEQYQEMLSWQRTHGCKTPDMPADVTPAPAPLSLSPEVEAIAQLMESRLREKEPSRGRGGWRQQTSEVLLDYLLEQLCGLKAAHLPGEPAEIAKKAADVANVAMMVADRAGGLADATPAPAPTWVEVRADQIMAGDRITADTQTVNWDAVSLCDAFVVSRSHIRTQDGNRKVSLLVEGVERPVELWAEVRVKVLRAVDALAPTAPVPILRVIFAGREYRCLWTGTLRSLRDRLVPDVDRTKWPGSQAADPNTYGVWGDPTDQGFGVELDLDKTPDEVGLVDGELVVINPHAGVGA